MKGEVTRDKREELVFKPPSNNVPYALGRQMSTRLRSLSYAVARQISTDIFVTTTTGMHRG